MAKFIASNRRSGKFTKVKKKASLQMFDDNFSKHITSMANILSDEVSDTEQGRRVIVFEADEDEIDAIQKNLGPDTLIEKSKPRFPCAGKAVLEGSMNLIDESQLPLADMADVTLGYTIISQGVPQANATVYQTLVNTQGETHQLKNTSDKDGQVSFKYYSQGYWPAGVMVVPSYDSWNAIFSRVQNGSVLECLPLPKVGETPLWHQLMGISTFDPTAGEGINIGIADTGVGPHPYLGGINVLGGFIDGQFVKDGQDSEQHGTHVAGILGARPTDSQDAAGYACGAKISAMRVFQSGEGAHQGDIALAIDYLSGVQKADLINLSLASPDYSAIEHDAILDSFERGTLCICAAANTGGVVEYPAALRETVAVSATGVINWGNPGGLMDSTYPVTPDKFSSTSTLYLAKFSCFGRPINSCAPGVGIISTVPTVPESKAPYLAMDGTSMSAPCTTGYLATVLSKHESYRKMERNAMRAIAARDILAEQCVDIGLRGIYQGDGFPVSLPATNETPSEESA